MNNSSNDNDEITPLELFDFTLPEVNKDRTSNNDFMVDLVQVSNEVSKTIILVSGVIPQKNIIPDKLDVLVGHIVRLFKLYDSYIFLIVNRRGEIAFMLLRTISETVINLSYLLKHLDTDVYKKYKRASIAYEKKLESKILKNISVRGYQMPIEERMLKSINSTFERAGLENLEEDELEKTKWGLTKEHLEVSGKASDVKLYEIYEHVFRNSSHFIHGSWHDLDFNNLERKKNNRGTRPPDMSYKNPVPQFLETAPILILRVLQEYLSKIVEPNDDFEKLKNHITKISNWFFEMSEKHEEYLNSNK